MKFGILQNKCKSKEEKKTPFCKAQRAYNSVPNTITRKVAGGIGATLGLSLGVPPGTGPTDFLNNIAATSVSSIFGLSPLTSLLATYTILSWAFILFGIRIFPGKVSDAARSIVSYIYDGLKSIPVYAKILITSSSLSFIILVFTWYYREIYNAGML